MIVSLLAGVVLCILLYHYVCGKSGHNAKLPPGPKGHPLFGALLDIKRSDVKGPGLFSRWADEFGDLYPIRLGVYNAVVISSPELIKDAFVKQGDKTSGRPSNVFFFRWITGLAGIVFNEGTEWKETRRHAVHVMRDFGMGKRSLEKKMQDEAEALIEVFTAQQGKPFDPKPLLHNAFNNVICSIVFGQRYDYGDKEFLFISTQISKLLANGGFKNPEMFIPYLTVLVPIINPSFMRVGINFVLISKFVRDKIRQRAKSFDPDHAESYIDVYLKAQHDRASNAKVLETNLLASIFDLFLTGSESSTTTMNWIFLYLVRSPDVQEKCQQEIFQVLGRDQLPVTKDKDRMPYMEATLCELQRLASIVSYGFMHRATEDIELGGYVVPKDYLLLSNFYHFHMHAKYWDEPEVFMPERWLEPDGRTLIKHEAYMPFSVGPRECLAKSMANHELFIILVSVLQKFTLRATDPDTPPEARGSMGITYTPLPYEIVAVQH